MTKIPSHINMDPLFLSAWVSTRHAVVLVWF